MPSHDIIVVGASAGGVEALRALVGNLPSDLPAAILVVLHVAPDHKSVLPHILSGSGPLPAAHANDGEQLLPGRIYVAPPDRHLVVDEDLVRLSRSAREGGHRPTIDTLFRTAPRFHGARVVAAVCSTRSTKESCCASAAASVTPTHQRRSAPSSGSRSRAPCGRPCVRWRSKRRSTGGSPRAPGSGASRAARPGSRKAARLPRIRPASCARRSAAGPCRASPTRCRRAIRPE